MKEGRLKTKNNGVSTHHPIIMTGCRFKTRKKEISKPRLKVMSQEKHKWYPFAYTKMEKCLK